MSDDCCALERTSDPCTADRPTDVDRPTDHFTDADTVPVVRCCTSTCCAGGACYPECC